MTPEQSMKSKSVRSKSLRHRSPYVRSNRFLMIIASTMEARMDLYTALSPLGCPMETCATAIEGLKAAACRTPALVILEWHLLDLSARTLIDTLRQMKPRTGAVLVVEPDDRLEENTPDLDPPWDALTRPVDPGKLLPMVDRLLNLTS